MKGEEAARNERWEMNLDDIESENPNDWRLAILRGRYRIRGDTREDGLSRRRALENS